MIAGRAILKGGGKITGGQLGRKENMVQPGAVRVTVVVKSVVMFGGASQSTIKKGGNVVGQDGPIIRMVDVTEARPVLRQVRTTVPVTSEESDPKWIESSLIKRAEKSTTFGPVSRGIHIRDRKSTATN